MKTLFVCSLMVMTIAVMADPTAPAPGYQHLESNNSVAITDTAPIRLQLIKQTDSGLVALINGQLLKPGDQLGRYQIIKIEKDQVLVQRDGQQQILHLLKTAIKNYD